MSDWYQYQFYLVEYHVLLYFTLYKIWLHISLNYENAFDNTKLLRCVYIRFERKIVSQISILDKAYKVNKLQL